MRCQERLGKCPAQRETWELDFGGCLFKREIRENSDAGRWSRRKKYPFCSGMRKGLGVFRDPGDLVHAHKARSFLCLDSCHGKGWDKPRMLCNANESQAYAKVCFITATSIYHFIT